MGRPWENEIQYFEYGIREKKKKTPRKISTNHRNQVWSSVFLNTVSFPFTLSIYLSVYLPIYYSIYLSAMVALLNQWCFRFRSWPLGGTDRWALGKLICCYQLNIKMFGLGLPSCLDQSCEDLHNQGEKKEEEIFFLKKMLYWLSVLQVCVTEKQSVRLQAPREVYLRWGDLDID